MRLTVAMPNSELQLRFRVRGAQLDPELLTSSLGIVPTRASTSANCGGRIQVGGRLGVVERIV